MKPAIHITRTLGIWIALVAGQIIGGMLSAALLHPPAMVMLEDGPFGIFDGMLVVCLFEAIVLALLAAHMRGSFLARAAALFGLYYGVQIVLSLIEAVYFNAYLKLAPELLWMMVAMNLAKALPACALAAYLWRGGEGPADRLTGHAWKIAAIVPLYIACYFSAGFLIAWQGADVRAYYEQGMNIDNGELTLLQVGRGLIWAGLAWIGASRLSGSTRRRAVLVGLAFGAFMAIQLLMPSSFMPWGVRAFHLMEIAVSNFLFGAASVLIWHAGAGRRVASAA